MADLKLGTTLGGAAVWSATNLPLLPVGNQLTYRSFRVYTEADKPNSADVGALDLTGGALTGNVTSTGDFTSTKIVQGQQVKATYRMGILRTGGTPGLDFIRPDYDSTIEPPATNQILGMIAFKEASKTADPHIGAARGVFQTLLMTDGTSRVYLDNRDAANVTKNRFIMDGSSGLTTFDVGGFRVTGGPTTLAATTTTTLNATTITASDRITATAATFNAANAGIEMGSISVAGTPYIDFHTSGTNVDYDIRLQASGTGLSVVSRTANIDSFSLKSVKLLNLNDTEWSGIAMYQGAVVIRDHANGNISLSASRKNSTDVVGGDIYLGFTNVSMNIFTNKVRLESEMNWKGVNQLVNTAGKLVGASLDTAYLPLTGGTMSGSIIMNRNGTPGLEMNNTAVDTSVALPTATSYSGALTFMETRAGTKMIRSKVESIITTSGGTQLNIYARDAANATKTQIRMETDTGLVNIATGGFRVAGTSTLIGEVSTSASIKAAGEVNSRSGYLVTEGNGNSHVWFNTTSGAEKAVLYAGSDKVFHIRSNGRTFNFGQGGNPNGLYVTDPITGDSNALIRGTVEAGGHAEWRSRSSGIQLDCPNANVSAYNVWKATMWGTDHIAAMDVHMAQGQAANAITRLLVGGQAYTFSGNGNMAAPNIVVGNAITAAGTIQAGTHVYSGGGQSYLRQDGQVYGPIWGGFISDWVDRQISGRLNGYVASQDAYAIGSFVMAINLGGSDIGIGGHILGSSLRPATGDGAYDGNQVMPGTWMCCGRSVLTNDFHRTTTWKRIA